jgi:nicotinate-nucleotide adenylyltransferase
LSARGAARTRRGSAAGRRIALFGGTFDPIHTGHVAVARAAQRRFHLHQVYFIPSSHPPHKHGSELSAYAHRFAMVALACAEHLRFVPSLAEASLEGASPRIFYSVDTVRAFRRKYNRPGDRLYFLVGADSFLHLNTWKEYEKILELCDFVVANRPGFPIRALRQVIPPKLLAPQWPHARADARAIPLRRTTVHLLDTVASHVSATHVRQRLARGQSIRGLVPARVEEYIIKQALYIDHGNRSSRTALRD